MKYLDNHLASYKYAFNGIRLVFVNERNMLIHLVAALVVLILNFLLNVSQTEWLITLILIGLVWMAEAFNTAIEKLADRITKDQDQFIGQVKDISAGAVLIICFFAMIGALIIYFPYVLNLI